MIIDAHQHFWQLDLPFQYDWLATPRHAPIHRNYLPEDLWAEMQKAGVDRSVFVQTQHDVAENRWALQLADQHRWIAGVVGWVDLASDACEAQLDEFSGHPKFVGVRHVTQDEPDDDYIIRDDVLRGLNVLEKHAVPFDLLFYDRHLRHAPTLAARLPDLPMVIDHLSKPEIRSGRIDPWRRELQRAAQYPNVYCKLSGMVTEADWQAWTAADLKPYVDAALEFFGPQRCMFGSDWPVCELAATYSEVVQTLRQLIGELSDAEQAEVLGQTAQRFYGLPDARSGRR